MSRIERIGRRADGTYGGRTFLHAVHAARWIVDLTANDDDREAGLRSISWGVVKSAATRRVWMWRAVVVIAAVHEKYQDGMKYSALADVVCTFFNARDTLARKATVEP